MWPGLLSLVYGANDCWWLVAAVPEVLGLAVLRLRAALRLRLRPAPVVLLRLRRLLPLPVRRRGLLSVRPLLPVRHLLPLLLSVLRGAGIPSATHPESSHVIESTWSGWLRWRSRALGGGLLLTCDIP